MGPDMGAGGVRRSYSCRFMEDMTMRTFDFSPFARNAIGFEPLFNRLNDWSRDANEGYPPYDIVRKGEDQFQINIALAGFSRDEITITAEASQLTVTGKKPEQDDTEYLYHGIAARSFERRFNLADYVEVESADFDNGLLHINLERRVPEKLKPRRIALGNVTQLEAKGGGKAA
jgi:molecular chaperone IbpA